MLRPRRDAAEVERDLAVPVRLADGAGTSVFSVIPSSQPGSSTSVAASISSLGADREARHEEEAAAELLGRVDLELDAAAGRRVGLRPLAERRSRGRAGRAKASDTRIPQRTNGPLLAADEVAVAAEGQLIGHGGHAEQFARGAGLSYREAATALGRLRRP